LAAFASLLKDCGIHGGKMASWLCKNKHAEMFRNLCLWTPQNSLGVHCHKNVTWYSFNQCTIFIEKVIKIGCNVSAQYRHPQIPPSDSFNTHAKTSITFSEQITVLQQSKCSSASCHITFSFNHLLRENCQEPVIAAIIRYILAPVTSTVHMPAAESIWLPLIANYSLFPSALTTCALLPGHVHSWLAVCEVAILSLVIWC
jgi:hypothetical protein